MAGYLINLSDMESLEKCISDGVYSTILSSPKGYWNTPHEATCCDYATMRSGDNIYFFHERKVYGIGELVSLKGDSKFLNYPGANSPHAVKYADIKPELLMDVGKGSSNRRWLCVFKPNPMFFLQGIDMDDLLASNPDAFKMLRAFWKVSFIKMGDVENQAFKEALIKLNEGALASGKNDCFKSDYLKVHAAMTGGITAGHRFSPKEILANAADGIHFKHEMALELGLLYQLSNPIAYPSTDNVFGHWDYLSHQVIASPFKPIDYMDKMDVFGYSYVKDYPSIKSKYLVVELKKGECEVEDVDQLLKYVDWIKEEYAFDDYSMIRAFLVGSDISKAAKMHAKSNANRKFTIGHRPAKSCLWDDLTLVHYSYNSAAKRIDFQVV